MNPIVRWTPPQQSEVPSYTLDYAKTYARAARKAYQDGIDQQTVLSNTLSSSLIGLGGVIAALAAYNAHVDAIVGTALFGGTAYALGSWNLSKPRVLILQGGVEGINCALRAVAPLDMSDTDLRELNAALARIDDLIPRAQQAAATARDALATATPSLSAKQIEDATKLIDDADRGIVAANTTLIAGRQLANAVRRAGTELINTVDRIDAAVSKAVLDTIPDLSAVPKVVGGLAGFAGSFAPGAGVEERINKALAAHQPPKAQSLGTRAAPISADVDALNRALSQLANVSGLLANVVAQVRSRIAGYETAAVTDSLKDCGVAEIAFPLRATPDTVPMAGGVDETSTVVVTGGIKPYVAILQQSPVEGLTVRTPPPFESTIQIVGTKSLAKGKTYHVTVLDSSTPSKTLTITITVGDTKANSSTASSPAITAPAAPALADIAKEIRGVAPFNRGTTDIVVASSVADTTKNVVTVTLRCKPPKPTPCVDPTATRDSILAQTASGASLGASDPKEKNKVALKSNPDGCLCAMPPTQ
jgi:hypothetical protein